MKHAVTGGFGYSGSYIVRRLLEKGDEVITLTNTSPKPDSPAIAHYPLKFDGDLVNALKGVDVLYNTYWVRFNHKQFTHQQAVANSRALFAAAKQAGVKRIVHVSITNPDERSKFEYFQGKALVERALIETQIPYTILRPAVLFGGNDILINNIAWLLRKLPVFGVFGDGNYRLQPIYVDDLAALAVEHGRASGSVILDAIGVETFTYRELVKTLGAIIGAPRPIIQVSPAIGYSVGWVWGHLLGDVAITREEIGGLMSDLLYVNSPSTGETRLTTWAKENASELGKHYASELARR